MLTNYLKYMLSVPHDTDFRFFRKLKNKEGVFGIIGNDNGQTLTTFRIYNSSYRVILFDDNPLNEMKIKAMNWLGGEHFRYFIARVGNCQEMRTLFVPRIANRMLKSQATYESEPLKKGETTSNLAEIVVETQTLDSFKLHFDAIRITPVQFDADVVEGMVSTLLRCKPILMIPNAFPTALEVVNSLERYFAPFVYNVKSHALKAFDEKSPEKNLFLVPHEKVEELTKVK